MCGSRPRIMQTQMQLMLDAFLWGVPGISHTEKNSVRPKTCCKSNFPVSCKAKLLRLETFGGFGTGHVVKSFTSIVVSIVVKIYTVQSTAGLCVYMAFKNE